MAKIFNKILCPIGFDRNSVAALKFADELTDPDRSTLCLLNVVSVPRWSGHARTESDPLGGDRRAGA